MLGWSTHPFPESVYFQRETISARSCWSSQNVPFVVQPKYYGLMLAELNLYYDLWESTLMSCHSNIWVAYLTLQIKLAAKWTYRSFVFFLFFFWIRNLIILPSTLQRAFQEWLEAGVAGLSVVVVRTAIFLLGVSLWAFVFLNVLLHSLADNTYRLSIVSKFHSSRLLDGRTPTKTNVFLTSCDSKLRITSTLYPLFISKFHWRFKN